MKKIKRSLFIFIFLLSGCSDKTDFKKILYYQLPFPLLKEATPARYTRTANTLWIKPVQLSDYLTTSGLVYQTSDVRYVTAQRHLWASPLDQQLQQGLLRNLSHALPDWFVSTQSINTDQWTLSVIVEAFQGRYDGRVIISGVWLLQHHDQRLKQPFYLELKQGDNGYDALVRILAKGWEDVVKSIATKIENQSGKNEKGKK